MKLNNTSQYAIRIVTFIVQNGSQKKCIAKDISEQLSIPYKYLTKIMSQLVDANIISSSKGREGGYTLTKEPNEIKLVDILEAVKECLHQTDCLLGIGACNEAKKCALHDQWLSPKKAILTMFKNTTLEEIVQGKIISL